MDQVRPMVARIPPSPSTILVFELPYSIFASKNRVHGLSKDKHLFVYPEAAQYRTMVATTVRHILNANKIKTNPTSRYKLMIRCWLPKRANGKGGRDSDAHNYIDWLADSVADGLRRDDAHFVAVGSQEIERVADETEAHFQIILEILP
jgi:(2Fe-2S) ferredoxin